MITFSIMTALLSCLIIMYCVLPLVEIFFGPEIDSQEKPFPYKMVFPYNPYHNWISYVLTYIFTSYAGICVVTTLFAEDTILGFFITYTCGQFRLLHEQIDKLFSGIVNPELAEEVQLERIKRVVQKHNNIIRLVFCKCTNRITTINLLFLFAILEIIYYTPFPGALYK